MSHSSSDLHAEIANHMVEAGLIRQTDIDHEDNSKRLTELTVEAVDRLTDVKAAAVTLIRALHGEAQASGEVAKAMAALNEALAAAEPPKWMVCDSHTHCFVGSQGSLTRWVADLSIEQEIHLVKGAVKVGGVWCDLTPAELDDLAADVKDNEIRQTPEDFGAVFVHELPAWAA